MPSPASPPASPGPDSAVVARLRAAGCVFAEDEARLLICAARTPSGLAEMVDQRVAGLPLEHVVGWAEFCGLRIAVDPGVFIPRRRTEFLVSQAVALVRQEPGRGPGPAHTRRRAVPPSPDARQKPDPANLDARQKPDPANPPGPDARQEPDPAGSRPVVVVDLCCGSGAVGAALAAALGAVEMYAVDVDPAAAGCARRNISAAGGQVYEGDLFQPLPAELRGRIDLLTANVPYVPSAEIALLPAEARIHEARVALDGGPDGLDVLRRVAAQAPDWLAPGGSMLVETSERQAPQAVEAIRRSGLIPLVTSSAEVSATVVTGTRPEHLAAVR